MTEVDVRVGQRMEIVDGVARLVENGEVIRKLEIQELPQAFIQWQLDYKRRVYDAIEKDEYIAFNAGHLPVVATLNDEGIIPNLANKGVGFTPKDEYIEHYVTLVEDAVEQIIKLPPHAVDDTRALRIATAREFYKHPEHIDWRRLGLLPHEMLDRRCGVGRVVASLRLVDADPVIWHGPRPRCRVAARRQRL